MKTIVLDDDPTGTQSAQDVDVVWEDVDTRRLRNVLERADTVFVQTNTRAIDEASAVSLLTRIRETALAAASGMQLRFVLRGDSTLRGHLFAETSVFAGDATVIVLAPAFPAGGRVTKQGVHLVTVDGRLIPVAETEYARDPVFPFRSSHLVDYVEEKSDRRAVSIPLPAVRNGSVGQLIVSAPPGTVLVPDAEDDRDITAIADAVRHAEEHGADVIVRCAAPMAAELGGVRADGLLSRLEGRGSMPLLVVCGSHTDGARRQLDQLDPTGDRVVVDTLAALDDPFGEGRRVATLARRALKSGLAILATERDRKPEHDRLDHGARVAAALSAAVADLRTDVGPIIAKGGITSAETARAGLGAKGGRVLGQLLPGVALWSVIDGDGRRHAYVVVPGNVGDERTLAELVERVGVLEGIFAERDG